MHKNNEYYQRKKYRIDENAYRTARQAVKNYERLMREKKGGYFTKAIESALQTIPKEYRKGVMGRLVKNDAFPLDASNDTYYLWCARYIRELAKQLDLI